MLQAKMALLARLAEAISLGQLSYARFNLSIISLG